MLRTELRDRGDADVQFTDEGKDLEKLVSSLKGTKSCRFEVPNKVCLTRAWVSFPNCFSHYRIMCMSLLRSLQLCLTLCDLWGVNDRLRQKRTQLVTGYALEWVAASSCRGSSRLRDWTCVSYAYLHWQVGSLLLVLPGKPIKSWP